MGNFIFTPTNALDAKDNISDYRELFLERHQTEDLHIEVTADTDVSTLSV